MDERARFDNDQLRGRLGILQAAATLCAGLQLPSAQSAVAMAYDLWDELVKQDDARGKEHA